MAGRPEFPEKGQFERGRTDPTSGGTWVYVSRAMAHAHPMGQLNWVLYVIVLYMAVLAASKVSMALQTGGGWVLWAAALLNLLTAFGLYFRVPWALILALLQIVFPIIVFVTALSNAAIGFLIAELVFLIFAFFYLIDSDRANLVYRYRYRAFGPLPGEDDAGEDA